MRNTILAWAIIALCCFMGDVLAERVNWNHFRQEAGEPVILVAKKRDRLSLFSRLELNGVRKEIDKTQSQLLYQLVGSIGGNTQVIWQAQTDSRSDYIVNVSFAIGGSPDTVGLIVIGRLKDYFYEIPLPSSITNGTIGEFSKTGPRLAASLPGRQLDFRRLVGKEYAEAEIEGVDLTNRDGSWDLRLTVSRLRINRDGTRVRVPGEERQIAYIFLQKPVGVQESKWSLLKTEEESDAVRTCKKNLRSILGAKRQWALAEGKKTGDQVLINQVDEYIKEGHPKCPEGGEYVYKAISAAPECTIHGVAE